VKAILDLGSSVPSQMLGTALLQNGERVREIRQRDIRTRYRLLSSLLAAYLPDWRFSPPAGGLVVWAELPYGSATDLTAVARDAGVAIVPGPLVSPSGRFDNHVRLPFVAEPDVLEEGIKRLARAWAMYARRETSPRLQDIQVVV